MKSFDALRRIIVRYCIQINYPYVRQDSFMPKKIFPDQGS